MATIHDLIEVTSISANTTYSTADGTILGVVDGASGTDLDDGEFDTGDLITIGGTTYTIDLIQEPSSSGSFLRGDGSTSAFGPQHESTLDVVFLTVSSGGTTRYFILPNDSYGDLNVQSVTTGGVSSRGPSRHCPVGRPSMPPSRPRSGRRTRPMRPCPSRSTQATPCRCGLAAFFALTG